MKTLLKYSPFVVLFFSLSCTTLSFIPKEGKAAKFNLATVEYVQSVAISQKEELVQLIKKDLDEILNSLLKDDRAALNNLENLLAEQEKRVNALAESVDSSNVTLGMLSAKLVKDISEVKGNTRTMQMYINQIEANLKTLPIEALQELNTALDEYMEKRSQEK